MGSGSGTSERSNEEVLCLSSINHHAMNQRILKCLQEETLKSSWNHLFKEKEGILRKQVQAIVRG